MLFSTRTLHFCKILIASLVILELCLVQEGRYANADRVEGLRYRPRMRSAKVAQSLREQVKLDGGSSSLTTKAPKQNLSNGKYEIRSVSGEPDYKSVNLTWEVEFVPASGNDAKRANSSNLTEESPPPKAFQIFFCELQSFGPHRCRSKLVNESAANTDDEVNNRQLRHFSAQVDNLRMATKYSFHIRPQAKFGRMKISARSGLFDNEVDDGYASGKNELNLGEQTIVIPTKGFSAEATKCLPHASEIEVETGPYFGGKIVVDGGNCGVKGNPEDPQDKYTMRIDHKTCGSLVKPETNTVETFITVQENLGIFTHSTRRFVVVCSFQSGMQTVRASFTVPGRDGMASAMENDPFEPDEPSRLGREQRHMRYVDRSALVLKENNINNDSGKDANDSIDQREFAVVKEVADPALSADSANSIATLEDILPGINEEDIKHESTLHSRRDLTPLAHARSAKYAKLVLDPNEVPEQRLAAGEIDEAARAYATTLHYIAGNIGSVVLTVSLTVIVIGVFIFIAFREMQRRRGVIRQNLKLQQQQQQEQQKQQKSSQQRKEQQKQATHLPHSTMSRTLQVQPTGTM